MKMLRPIAHESWVRELPISRMVRPRHPAHRAKYLFWRIITPVHPKVRAVAERIGIRRERFVAPDSTGRQRFLIGMLAPGYTARDIAAHLIGQGYGNHFVAWQDDGQVLSLRLVEDFAHQYHLRVFEDGEIRGHYEYTPECYPIRHVRSIGQEDRREVFYKHLGRFIVRA